MLWIFCALLLLIGLRLLGRAWARNDDRGGYPPWPRFLGRARVNASRRSGRL